MRLVCDLEIHSKYARAVSKDMVVPEMVKWAKRKGIDIIGTGDFTHPLWMRELKQHLEEDGTGLLKLKIPLSSLTGNDNAPDRGSKDVVPAKAGIPDQVGNDNIRFMLTSEVSLIYTQGGKGRRVHIIIVAPSLEVAVVLNERLAKIGNLSSDGRPILGLSAKWLLEYILEINRKFNLTDNPAHPEYRQRPGLFLIPAHVWTPWFGLLGSKSGFDSLEECFGELTPHVRAIETGLSSDLPMNWRLSANDNVALVSFSDAHSAPNLMREATVVEVGERAYADIAQALQNPHSSPQPSPQRGERESSSALSLLKGEGQGEGNHIAFTLEFFPEEGKYHYDGIAAQKLRLSPKETEKLRKENPELAKKVTVGVLSRVEELADRPEGFQPDNRPGSISMVPLQEIIADVVGVGKQSKRVQREYEQATSRETEFRILTQLSREELLPIVGETVTDGIMTVREGKAIIEPGYDGIFGTIKIPKREYNSGDQQMTLL